MIVWQFLVAAEEDGEALFFWKGGDGVVEGGFQLVLLGLLIRAWGGKIGELKRLVVIAFGFDWNLFAAAAAAGFVENEVTSDGKEPSGEFGGGFVARSAFPHPEEDLLGDVVSVIHIIEHASDGADDGVLVELDELFEGFDIAFFDSEHQGGAEVIGGRVEVGIGGCRRAGGFSGPDRIRHEKTGGKRSESSGAHEVCKPCRVERVAQ